jgi:hypothetical protein
MDKFFSALAILFVCAPIDAQEAAPPKSNTIAWKGHNFYLYGVNYPWVNYGTDFGSGPLGHAANPDQVKADMATFANEGGHILRWWVWVDGRNGLLFGGDGHVTGLTPLFFSDLDTQLQYAADNHIYLDLALLDTSILDTAHFYRGVQNAAIGPSFLTGPCNNRFWIMPSSRCFSTSLPAPTRIMFWPTTS